MLCVYQPDCTDFSGNGIGTIRNQASVDAAVNDEHRKQISALRDFIRAQPTTVTEFDEALVRRLIAKIVVFEDRFIVEFKSGLSIDIQA